MRDKLYTLGFMVVTATVLTGVVAAVREASRERVQLNEDLARKRVVMRVLGIDVPEGADLREAKAIYEQCVETTQFHVDAANGSVPVYAGRTAEGEPLGYCFETSGRGFWDTIRGYVALTPDMRTVKGLAFFQQSETPGLGAEITKPWFEAQFLDRQLPPEVPSDGVLIHLRPPDQEKGPYDVDAITGASGTSKAVQTFLNRDLLAFMAAMGGTVIPASGATPYE